jgi:large-conductance mechanosensitive channel
VGQSTKQQINFVLISFIVFFTFVRSAKSKKVYERQRTDLKLPAGPLCNNRHDLGDLSVSKSVAVVVDFFDY